MSCGSSAGCPRRWRPTTGRIAIEPKFAEAHANRGRVLAAMNRAAEARASFERASKLDPKFASLLQSDYSLIEFD